MPVTRVAIVMAWYAPYRLPLFRSLATLPGIDLTVILCSEAEYGPVPEPESQPFTVVVLKAKTLLKYRYRNVFTEKNAIRFPSGLFAALRKAAPDVIVAYEFRPECMAAALFSALYGCAYVTWSDTIAAYEARMGNLRKLIRRVLLSRSAALIGSSTETVDFFGKAYSYPRGRSFLSILSAHVDDFIADSANHPPLSSRDGIVRFISVCRLIPLKGLDLLVEAFAAVRRTVPHVHLTLVGQGEEEAALRQLARERGCGDSITFRGFIPNDRLSEEFLDHDVFVFPTKLDVFGLVVAEAVACGLPVICSSRAGAARDLVAGNGVVVDPENVPELAAVMEKLAVRPELRKEMSKACRQIMERHNLASAVRGFVGAVNRALPQNSPVPRRA